MRRLLALALVAAGCGGGSTSLRLDITEGSDVPVLDSVLVQLYGSRGEIGSGTAVSLANKSRSGQILVTDIDPMLAHLRVLLTGFDASHTLRAQAALDVKPIPNTIVEVAVQLSVGALPDRDGDGVPDSIDDCPDDADPTQGDPACAPPDLAGHDGPTTPRDLSMPDGPPPPPRDLAMPDGPPPPPMDLSVPDSAPTYQIGGMASGVSGTLVLLDNGGDALNVTTSGAFHFATKLPTGAPYAVTVGTQPAGQLCTVTSGSGHVNGADVTDVAVTCTAGHTITVTVAGLTTGPLVLDDNGGDPLNVTMNGMFTFATPVAEGSPYAVTVATQPPGQFCSITNDMGVVSTMDVSNVMVSCRALSVVVNEVYARPATNALGDTNGDGVRDSTGDEFVELMNNETFAVDVSGWVLKTGSASPVVRLTFPSGTSLPAGARAVVFGGGLATGGFGGAQTFIATGGLSLTDAPSTNFTVSIGPSAAALDTYTYGATTFGSSCTNTCASQTRSPEGTGAFTSHPIAAGSAGVLWSPGTSATGAIPKVETPFSGPAPGAANVSVLAFITPQFNMFMNPSGYTNTNLHLYASPCSAIANEVTSFSSIGPGNDASSARLIPTAALGFASTYCVQVDAVVASPFDVPIGSAVTWEFNTRAAASAPAATVVLSEVGGCRLETSGGTTSCGTSLANDEFVELYNPTASAIDVSGWFVQRRTAGGTASCAATLPAATMIQPGHFFLVGGVGYTAAEYAGTPAADLTAAGSLLTGATESLVLISSAGSCTGSSNVIDSVSLGNLTDTLAALQLPSWPNPITDGTSIERKACYNSTGDADGTTGMLAGGGHAAQGNSEKIRAGNADWVARSSPNPQNSTAAAETRSCP